MSSSTLYRTAAIFGLLAFLANLTLGIGGLFIEHNSAQYTHLSLVGAFGQMLFMFLLVAVYFRQYQRLGMTGLAGFALAFAANSLFTIGQISTAYIDEINNLPTFIAGPLFGLGLLLLAIANHRNGVLPAWALWLMFIGHLVSMLNPTSISVVQSLIFSAGILWVSLSFLKPQEAAAT